MSTVVSKSLPQELVLFPDTNIFIEAKDLRQAPWDELATDEITLLVCATVRTEIDDHKTSDKNRVRKRALDWNPEFKKLLKPGASPLVLREKSPRVTLAMVLPISGGPAHTSLDLKEPDDRLVDATIKYRDSHTSEDVRLFTDDTGPIGKAYELSLDFIDLPLHWRRDLGPDEKDKEIETLTRKLALHEQNCPSPSILFLDERGQKIAGVQLIVTRYPILSSAEVDALIDELRKRHPLPTPEQLRTQQPDQSTDWGRRFLGFDWRPPSDGSISKFLNEDYPAWLNKVREVLFQLGPNLTIESSIRSFRIDWSNIGARPAESAKLTVKIGGHFSLLRDDVEAAKLFTQPTIPLPPRPPEGRLVTPLMGQLEWVSAATRLGQLTGVGQLHATELVKPLPLLAKPERQKNAWYLQKEKTATLFTREKIFTCDEWKHQEEAVEKTFSLSFDSSQSSGSNNVVTVIFHANNLPEPVRKILRVKARVENCDVLERARQLLGFD